MVKHIVMFKLQGSDEARREVAQRFKAALDKLPSQIDVLQSIETALNENPAERKPGRGLGYRPHGHRAHNGRCGHLCQASGPRGCGGNHQGRKAGSCLRRLQLLEYSCSKTEAKRLQ